MNIEKLPESEELIMSVIWNFKEDLRAYDIIDLVKDRFKRDWKPQTALTLLERLSKKGFVDSYRDKKEYKREYIFFYAKISKEKYLLARFKEMQEIWFNGNKENMKQFVEDMTK